MNQQSAKIHHCGVVILRSTTQYIKHHAPPDVTHPRKINHSSHIAQRNTLECFKTKLSIKKIAILLYCDELKNS